jgi:hypothetical protein
MKRVFKTVLYPQLVMISGPLGHWGENYSVEAHCHCVKVWSVVVQRELSSLPLCLLVCNFGGDGVDGRHYW